MAEGTTVTLDGSASSDLDGDDLIYLWTQPLEQTVALTNEATSMATFTAPDVMTGTINLTFNLTVTDPDGLNHVDTVTIAVSAAPTANITVVEASTLLSFTAPAFGFLAGETVTVNGANSTDPALMGLTYQWTGTGGAAFTDSTVVAPGLTLPALLSASSAVYTLTLVVTDGLNQPSEPVMVMLNIDRPVMADAGVDQTATTGGDVTLNGGASVNHALASADPLTYSWMQTDGSPTVALTNANTSMPTFTAPPTRAVLTFSLTVSGSYNLTPSGSTNAATVTVTVAIPTVNQRPTAEAGDAQSVAEGTTVTLDGSGSSDLDGDDLIYLWTQPLDQTVALTNETASMATFTAPDVMTVTINLTFNLTVTDPDGLNHVDTVTIAVSAAPTANITVVEASTLLSFTAPAFGFLAGETVTVNGANSTDPALMGLTYQWTGTGGAAFTDSTVVAPGLTLPALLSASSAVYTLTLVVTDGLNQPSEPVMVTLNIDRPVMADAGVDQTATTGGDVTLNGRASVNHALTSADPLTYSWMQTDGSPTVALTNANTSMPTFTAPPTRAVLTFSLTVSGSYNLTPSGSTNAATVTVTVAIPTVNQRPTAEAGDAQSVAEGTTVTLDGSASSDLDGDDLIYLWTQPLEQTVALTNETASMATFTAPDVMTGTINLTFNLTVTDPDGLNHVDTVTIAVSAAPTANITVVEASTLLSFTAPAFGFLAGGDRDGERRK